MIKGFFKFLFLFAVMLTFAKGYGQQLYTWEEQAKLVVVQAEELMTDTTQQVAAFKESLQSLIKESFQVSDSYKRTADSLQKEITAVNAENEKMISEKKGVEELKMYFIGGAGLIILILLILVVVFALKSSRLNSKYKKTAGELKEINSTVAKIKEDAVQCEIRNDRLNAELKDSLEDVKSLDDKNKLLIESETKIKKEVESLQVQNSDMVNRLTSAESLLSSKNTQTEELSGRIIELESKIEAINREKDNIKRDSENLVQQKFSEFERMKSELESERESIFAKASAEADKIKAEKEQESQHLGSRIKDLEAELITARAEVSGLKNEYEKKLTEISDKHNTADSELSGLRTEISALMQKIETIQQQSEENLQQANRHKAVTDSLHTEKQNMAAEMTALYNQSLILEGENRSLKAEIDNLKANVEKEIQARVRIDRELEKFVEELKGFLPLP